MNYYRNLGLEDSPLRDEKLFMLLPFSMHVNSVYSLSSAIKVSRM
jgi:hypothetical protein